MRNHQESLAQWCQYNSKHSWPLR